LAIILKFVKRLGNRSIDATKKTAAIQGPKLATASETSNNTRVLCNVNINGAQKNQKRQNREVAIGADVV